MLPDVIEGGAALTFALTAVTLLKPFVEALPGVGESGAVHDNALRILTFALALASLVVMFKIEAGIWPYGTELLNDIGSAGIAAVGATGVYHAVKDSTPEAKAKKKAAKGTKSAGVAVGAPPVSSDVSAPVPAGEAAA